MDYPPLSPDNWTTIVVAFLAFGSAWATARFAARKNGTNTLTRMQLQCDALKVRVQELDEDLREERNKRATEMKHRIEAEEGRKYAERQLEAMKRSKRRKRTG